MAQHFHDIGYAALKEYQKEVYKECIIRKKAGLSLKMGFGKTLLSLVVGLYQKSQVNEGPILIIASKTLIASWLKEIQKFLPGIPVEYIETKIKDTWIPERSTLIILTTPEVLSKGYNNGNVGSKFAVIVEENNQQFANLIRRSLVYTRPTKPFLTTGTGCTYFFKTKFSSYIVDEAQNFSNIDTATRGKALAAICSENRWLLSGTMFDEPKIEKILGYYMMLDIDNFPRSLKKADEYIRSPLYRGLKETLITMEIPEDMALKTVINKHIITHKLNPYEELIYKSMKNTLKIIKKQATEAQLTKNKTKHKKFTAYLLVVISYLRQCIVSSMIPLTIITLNMLDFKNRTALSKIMTEELENSALKEGLDMKGYLNDSKNILSSRISEVFKTIKEHITKKSKIVLFSCYARSLDLIEYLLIEDETVENLEIYRISSDLTTLKRGAMVDKFNESDKNSKKVKILLVTYGLGAEGLNLQTANVAILLDLWWNNGKTNQSIARIARQGQLSAEIDIYLYTSNTGIERAVLEKQADKMTVFEELFEGSQKTSIQPMKTVDILKLLDSEDNFEILEDIVKNNNNGKVADRKRNEDGRYAKVAYRKSVEDFEEIEEEEY